MRKVALASLALLCACGGRVIDPGAIADAAALPDDASGPPDTWLVDDSAPPPPWDAPTPDLGPPWPPSLDRKVTVVLGAPDLAPQLLCIGVWLPDSTGGPDLTKPPLMMKGPWGIPSPDGKLHPLPYGSTWTWEVRDADDIAALDSLAVAIFRSEIVDPTPDGCKVAVEKGALDRTRFGKIPKGRVAKGTSWLLGITGCSSTSTTGECGSGSNREWILQPLTIVIPDRPGSVGNLEIFDLSRHASFQNADLTLGRISGGSIGAIMTLTNASYGVRAPLHTIDFVPESLYVRPTGTPLCVPGSSGCANVAIDPKASAAKVGGFGGIKAMVVLGGPDDLSKLRLAFVGSSL